MFEGYADYMGYDSVDELRGRRGLEIWFCDDCDVKVPVSASDPQGYGPAFCPECLDKMDVTSVRKIEDEA